MKLSNYWNQIKKSEFLCLKKNDTNQLFFYFLFIVIKFILYEIS